MRFHSLNKDHNLPRSDSRWRIKRRKQLYKSLWSDPFENVRMKSFLEHMMLKRDVVGGSFNWWSSRFLWAGNSWNAFHDGDSRSSLFEAQLECDEPSIQRLASYEMKTVSSPAVAKSESEQFSCEKSRKFYRVEFQWHENSPRFKPATISFSFLTFFNVFRMGNLSYDSSL